MEQELGIFDRYIQVVIICQELKKFVVCRDGPIPIPNTRYYRYQRLEEKYRILAGNIDYFDTAEPAIFLIVASGLMIKMTVLFLNLFIYYFIIIYLSRRYKILNMLRN